MMPNPAIRTNRERVPTEADRELDAYNAAFEELELHWHWDRAILHELAAIGDERARIVTYLQRHRPHLLKVYDADAIAAEIVEVKERMRVRSAGTGRA